MSALFSKPSAPTEDPNVVALREREQRRAQDDQQRQTQLGLAQQTARRRGLGLRSLLGPAAGGDLTQLLGSG